MMAQTGPSYGGMTSVPNPLVLAELIRKYTKPNVVWPIVLIQDNRILGYIYERTAKNTINTIGDQLPMSTSGLICYFLDYTSVPRQMVSGSGSFSPKGAEPFLYQPSRQEYGTNLGGGFQYAAEPSIGPLNPSWVKPMLSADYECSYEYILNSPYSTVDIDYAWYTGQSWKGMELTTFWVEFTSQRRAEEVICKMNRRPSWQGPEGPHGLRKIVSAAKDLKLDMYMVCVNTIGKVSNQFKIDGNVYLFPLSDRQIDRLLRGEVPEHAIFCTFAEFLAWL